MTGSRTERHWGAILGKRSLGLLAAFGWPLSVAIAGLAIPSAERLLPEETVAMITAPDFARVQTIFSNSPVSQLWNDPAMRPFKEKFLVKWREEFLQPLEREINVSFDDYLKLPQGQVTLAFIRDNAPGEPEKALAKLLLVDTKNKSGQLKTNLATVQRKWLELGKTVRIEKIRGFEFMALLTANDEISQTLDKVFAAAPEVQELDDEDQPKKPQPKNELVIGQVDSLLIVGNSARVVEKVVTQLSGGTVPSLGELAAYDLNHQALFRGAPVYGWVNFRLVMDSIVKKSAQKKEPGIPNPFAAPPLDRILTATGLGGIRTIAFSVQNTREGVLGQVFVGLPEASRQGIFKILGGESREFAPPAFVPADAVKFQRWRLDLQKTWAVLDKAFRDLSPDSANGLNFILDMANTAARDKDPGFDIRKNLIGNLGDEIITYQKAPRGTTAEQLNSPPSLFLIGSPQAEQLVSALKSIFTFLNSEGGPPAEREFLGRKIFSLPKPTLPFMPAENTRAAPATLSYAASGGYIAFSTDLSMLEEFLRSNARDLKALRATPGLLEASQAVTGSGTGFLAFENQGETMRARFEQLRRGSAITNSVPAFNPMTAALGISLPELNFKQWVDFSLLPPFEKVARYFHFTVYGGSANMDGLSLKMFTPAPPGLNREK